MPILHDLGDFVFSTCMGEVAGAGPVGGVAATVTVWTSPLMWSRLATELHSPGLDVYVDPRVEADELILHLPMHASWRRQIRVLVVGGVWLPDGLWLAVDASQSWPPNLDELLGEVLWDWEDWHGWSSEEFDDDSDDVGEDRGELPPVPMVRYQPHRYAEGTPDAGGWMTGPEPSQPGRRRGRYLDDRVPALWGELRRAGSSPDDARAALVALWTEPGRLEH